MPIDPETHRLWYHYIFQALPMGKDGTRGPAIQVKADGYQQCVSIGAFLNGVHHRRKPHDIKTHRVYDTHTDTLWIGKSEHDYEIDQKINRKHYDRYKRTMPAAPELAQSFLEMTPDPTIFFDNVFDFYDHIGYDHKKKRIVEKTC